MSPAGTVKNPGSAGLKETVKHHGRHRLLGHLRLSISFRASGFHAEAFCLPSIEGILVGERLIVNKVCTDPELMDGLGDVVAPTALTDSSGLSTDY
jgi:hypothetical protein